MSIESSPRSRSFWAIAGVFLAVCVFSASADAAHHGKGHNMPKFADIDLDGNGAVVAAEFYEARAKHMAERAKAGGKMKNAANAPTFESIDLDDNGEISPEEFATHQAEMMEQRRARKAEKSE